jgi:hypothetical protein
LLLPLNIVTKTRPRLTLYRRSFSHFDSHELYNRLGEIRPTKSEKGKTEVALSDLSSDKIEALMDAFDHSLNHKYKNITE